MLQYITMLQFFRSLVLQYALLNRSFYRSKFIHSKLLTNKLLDFLEVACKSRTWLHDCVFRSVYRALAYCMRQGISFGERRATFSDNIKALFGNIADASLSLRPAVKQNVLSLKCFYRPNYFLALASNRIAAHKVISCSHESSVSSQFSDRTVDWKLQFCLLCCAWRRLPGHGSAGNPLIQCSAHHIVSENPKQSQAGNVAI